MNTGELLQACREMLNDLAPPYGWDDAQLVRYLNNAVGEACLRARLLKDDVSTRGGLLELVLGIAHDPDDPGAVVRHDHAADGGPSGSQQLRVERRPGAEDA